MFKTSSLRAAIVVVMTSCIVSASRDYERRDDLLLDALRVVRRNQCADLSSACFSTGQCCAGLVCAAFDDYLGQKPEVPGSCVKEKDLKLCATAADCDGNERCLAVGRSSELYCLPRPRGRATGAGSGHGQTAPAAGGGGLGAACETTADCRPTTNDGRGELCCKNVNRGRLGSKRLCDRVETSATCISGDD